MTPSDHPSVNSDIFFGFKETEKHSYPKYVSDMRMTNIKDSDSSFLLDHGANTLWETS